MVQKNPLELLEDSKQTEEHNCYSLKYWLTAIRYNISNTCSIFIHHPLFESFCLCIIITNCIFLAIEDPKNPGSDEWQVEADYIFQALYTAEIIVKVLALGFFFGENSYIKNPWNILDFVIVLFGYLSYVGVSVGGINLKALRTLRTISTVEGLRMLIEALVSSLPLLLDILLILSFYFLTLAIAGIQLWHGILKSRCLNVETGTVDDTRCCGSFGCGNRKCVDYISNPSYGGTSYDDVFAGVLVVFQCVTLENWSFVEQNVCDAFGPAGAIYFTLHTLIGSFFLMNFMLAVIKSRVSRTYEENRKLKNNKSKNNKS